MKKFYLISFIFILVDRVLKILVQNFLTSNALVIIKNFFYLVYAKNEGAAFSILEGGKFFFIIFATMALIYIYYYVRKNNVNNIGYAMLFSGIIGNLIDRILYGFVIDYVGIYIFNYAFPIFNFADAIIIIGAIFILLGSDKNEIKN